MDTMKQPGRVYSIIIRPGALILIILMGGLVLWGSQAEAVLTAQSMSGTVEMLAAGQQTWVSLGIAAKLQAGDQVRTGSNSSVDLWFEDGSLLSLAGGTQLQITELEISTAQKSRVARFKLLGGTVTAKVTQLAFAENICEIETDTMVAEVKFSEMTVVYPQNALQAEVIARQGLVSIRRIAVDDRIVNIRGILSEAEGIQFVLPPTLGSEVFVGIQKILGKIEVESAKPLEEIGTFFEAASSFVKIDNIAVNPMYIIVEDSSAELAEESSTTFGIPQGQKMFLRTVVNTDFSLAIKRRSAAIVCEGLYVFLNGGDLQINGEPVDPGVPNCLPLGGLALAQQPDQGESRSLIQQLEETEASKRMIGGEQPVIPAAPQSQMPAGADILPPTPTPTPTETPTPTPTPTPTETPIPTPTPTETPKPTPTLPPVPTETPASPIVP